MLSIASLLAGIAHLEARRERTCAGSDSCSPFHSPQLVGGGRGLLCHVGVFRLLGTALALLLVYRSFSPWLHDRPAQGETETMTWPHPGPRARTLWVNGHPHPQVQMKGRVLANSSIRTRRLSPGRARQSRLRAEPTVPPPSPSQPTTATAVFPAATRTGPCFGVTTELEARTPA